MKIALVIATCVSAAVPALAQAMPNPASTFCVAMDGRSVLATLPDGGTIGLCYLPGRTIVEEWTLFRMLHGKVPAAGAGPFR